MNTCTNPTYTFFVLLLFFHWSSIAGTTPSCEYANTNIDFVKTQTQTALAANDLQLVKLFTNNALEVIDQTKTDFIDCGCTEANTYINSIEKNLKQVAGTTELETSRIFLRAALQNARFSIQLLRKHEEQNSSYYGDDVLVMNTKAVLKQQGGVVVPIGKARLEMIDKSIAEFRQSIADVVAHVECKDAFVFVTKLHKNAKKDLEDVSLSENEIFYHQKVRDITYEALLKLNGCPLE